jgi:hypothetical protein
MLGPLWTRRTQSRRDAEKSWSCAISATGAGLGHIYVSLALLHAVPIPLRLRDSASSAFLSRAQTYSPSRFQTSIVGPALFMV